jgi:KUP system potassium uptake protein
VDDPYTSEYSIKEIIPNEVIRVEFRLGFRVQPRTNLMFKKVVDDLVKAGKISIDSKYETMQQLDPIGDVQFIVMEKYLSGDNELPLYEKLIMNFHFWIKDRSLSEEKGFGLNQSNVAVEKFPLVVAPVSKISLKQVH